MIDLEILDLFNQVQIHILDFLQKNLNFIMSKHLFLNY